MKEGPIQDEWELRGELARLKCWHRLTGEEEDDLLRFAAARPASAAPVQEPVAWVNRGENIIERVAGWDGYGALYTAPPAQPAQQEPVSCECHRCIAEQDLRINGLPLSMGKMILCPTCGNKRCPKASDHRLDCTGSNEPNQPAAQPAPVQEPVAWPCEIEEADFGQNTVTVKMLTPNYAVRAGKHWLSTTLPAQPAPVQQEQEPVAWVEQSAIDWLSSDKRGPTAYVKTALSKRKDSMATTPVYTTPPAAAPVQEPVAWAEEIIADLHALYDSEMITENDSGDALIRLDAAICAVEEAEKRHTTQPAADDLIATYEKGFNDCAAQRQPLTHEQEIALREGHWIAHEDEYFKARPTYDFTTCRRTFEAGFKRGWKASLGITNGGDK